MPDGRQLQHRQERPSVIDAWNKSIAIRSPIRGVDTTTTKTAVQQPRNPHRSPSANNTAVESSSSNSNSNSSKTPTPGRETLLTRPTLLTTPLTLHTTPLTLHATLSLVRTLTITSLDFALNHPNFMKRYAFPFALNVFSRPLVALLPLGPLGPILAFVAVACGRFKLRREFMGGGYAVLHAVGMAGVKGQALSLLGLVGLEATGKYLPLFFLSFSKFWLGKCWRCRRWNGGCVCLLIGAQAPSVSATRL